MEEILHHLGRIKPGKYIVGKKTSNRSSGEFTGVLVAINCITKDVTPKKRFARKITRGFRDPMGAVN